MIEIKTIISESDNIQQTVGLPCYNAKEIGWLAMEGLCNQIEVEWDWELIVCEEKHEKQLGIGFFEGYIDGLRKVNCKRILYIELNERVLLIKKWQLIGQQAHINSRSFLLHAVDCYSTSYRLFLSHHLIMAGYDWVDFTKGYFYSFVLNRLILYDCIGLRNLSMGFRTAYARNIPNSDKTKGIDSFLFRSFKPLNVKRVNMLYEDSLDTDGFNNITNRNGYYENPESPFKATNKTIDNIGLPYYIKKRIKSMILKKSVSVLVPAYNSHEYVEDCLDSINIQTYFQDNDSFEILIGVDGCVNTLNKLIEIKDRYRNIKIYWMPENKGTYITLNALLDKARFDNIVIFGSDDIMIGNMVETLANSKGDLIRPRFYLLNDSRISKSYSCGAIWAKKEVFDMAGGFEPWIIAADRDLISRIQNHLQVELISDRLFYYRKYNGSMTSQYNSSSELRNELHKRSNENIKNNVLKIERIVNLISDEY